MSLSGNNWIPELWLAVIASGVYHGVNPGMGWPLAVSAGLMEQKTRALFAALAAIAVGHFAAMVVVLLPFAALSVLVSWQREIQLAAGIGVLAFGIFRFINRRHPRVLARIRPTQLALWSLVVAIAHGAGLMLVPIYLGLCAQEELDAGHRAASIIMSNSYGAAIAVSLVHAAAMIVSGGIAAWLVYRYLGLRFLSKSWFNLDGVWAVSLIVVGAMSVWLAL